MNIENVWIVRMGTGHVENADAKIVKILEGERTPDDVKSWILLNRKAGGCPDWWEAVRFTVNDGWMTERMFGWFPALPSWDVVVIGWEPRSIHVERVALLAFDAYIHADGTAPVRFHFDTDATGDQLGRQLQALVTAYCLGWLANDRARS